MKVIGCALRHQLQAREPLWEPLISSFPPPCVVCVMSELWSLERVTPRVRVCDASARCPPRHNIQRRCQRKVGAMQSMRSTFGASFKPFGSTPRSDFAMTSAPRPFTTPGGSALWTQPVFQTTQTLSRASHTGKGLRTTTHLEGRLPAGARRADLQEGVCELVQIDLLLAALAIAVA